MSSNLKAIYLAFSGFIIWVFADTCLKFVGQSSLPKYEIMTFMSLGAIITIIAATFFRNGFSRLRANKPIRFIHLGVLLLISVITLLASVKYLPLTSVYAISFLGPMVVALLAAVFLGERLTWKHYAAIVVGFGGVVVAIDPYKLMGDVGAFYGYVAAFVFLFVTSINLVLLRFYGDKESYESMAFYPRIVAGLGGLIACAVAGYEPANLMQIFYMLSAGFFAGAGWLLMSKASQIAQASVIAPYRYFQIVAGAITGYVIWGDIPTLNVIVGALIITAAGIYMTLHAKSYQPILE